MSRYPPTVLTADSGFRRAGLPVPGRWIRDEAKVRWPAVKRHMERLLVGPAMSVLAFLLERTLSNHTQARSRETHD